MLFPGRGVRGVCGSCFQVISRDTVAIWAFTVRVRSTGCVNVCFLCYCGSGIPISDLSSFLLLLLLLGEVLILRSFCRLFRVVRLCGGMPLLSIKSYFTSWDGRELCWLE